MHRFHQIRRIFDALCLSDPLSLALLPCLFLPNCFRLFPSPCHSTHFPSRFGNFRADAALPLRFITSFALKCQCLAHSFPFFFLYLLLRLFPFSLFQWFSIRSGCSFNLFLSPFFFCKNNKKNWILKSNP